MVSINKSDLISAAIQTEPPFTLFEDFPETFPFSRQFTGPFTCTPNLLSMLAVQKLQVHLLNKQNWVHHFGSPQAEGTVAGKMFGVLVVQTKHNELGYLSAFSGKLAGGNYHPGFVPPLFDGMAEGGFLNSGMSELSRINAEIELLVKNKPEMYEKQINLLKTMRRVNSVSLQNEIFDQYHFLNQAGKKKSLREIFNTALYKNPPAGAGECAAPKLLQYAFQHSMKPLAMAEFWWGSPKSDSRKHGQFYPACKEKCTPILAHMLSGMEGDQLP